MTTKGKETPAALHSAKNDSATSPNQDGNAAHTHEDITVVSELARIADELHALNQHLTITPKDGAVAVQLAHLIAEIGNGRVRR